MRACIKFSNFRNYYVMDAFTGKPRIFDSEKQARTYAELSFGPYPKRNGAIVQTRAIQNYYIEVYKEK